jgi:hypothetical protein
MIDHNCNRLPSFFCVGVQKAGTTTFHNWLSRQPDVCLPTIKETHFFSHDDRFVKGTDWYLSQFEGGRKDSVFGEVDPDYAFYEQAPHRIKKFVPNPKFIFIFRHPIERALSHYMMSVRRGFETLSFEEALLAEEDRCSSRNKHYLSHYSYLARGRYVEQVSRFQKIFPDAEFFFLKFDDLFNQKTCVATYRNICRFIGLNSTPITPDLTQKLNPASKSRSKFIQKILYENSRLKRLTGSIIRSSDTKLKIALWLERLNQKSLTKSEISGLEVAFPPEIWEGVKKEILELEKITSLKLKNWFSKDFLKGPL